MSNPTEGRASLSDLKRATGMGLPQVKAGINSGQLPGRKIGGQYISRWEWINAWLEGKPGFWDTPQAAPRDITKDPIAFVSRAHTRKAS